MSTAPVDTMMLETQIIEAIRTCFDPEIPVNIYDLGLIYGVKVDPLGAAEIQMTLTSPSCPSAASLPEEVRMKAEEIPGVTSVMVDLVFDPPWDPSRMSEVAKLRFRDVLMPYIVAEPCIGVQDHGCVDACPVDCFYQGDDQVLIHPDECIDCGACIAECPVGAIYEVGSIPEFWKSYVVKNAAAFRAGANPSRALPHDKWEAERHTPGTPAYRYYQQYGKPRPLKD